MRRGSAALYGALAYLAFLGPIAYLVGFLADAWVPKTVNRGAGAPGPALWVDVGLVALFGIQHSVMARPGFKARLARWVPEPLERSTYVLVSGLTLVLLFALWRPIPGVLWDLRGTPGGALLQAGFVAGWALAVWATFALSHLHLFGVSQVASFVRGQGHPRPALRRSLLYRLVRHPMTAGLLLAFWSTPRMTAGHLVFAAAMTVYSLWATALEERDLLGSYGDAYAAYRREVPALVPLPSWGRLGPGLGAELSAVAAVLLALSWWVVRDAARLPPLAGELPVLEFGTVPVDSLQRSFGLFRPAERSDSGPRPLILALHGTGGGARRLQAFLGGELERVADREGWLVAYPEAVGGAWNDCRAAVAQGRGEDPPDDVAFLERLVAHLARRERADPRRVYLVGYSGGGHLSFRVALEAPELAGGIAVFGASLPVDEELTCTPVPGSVPLLLVNGEEDPVSPLDGGPVVSPTGLALGRVRSVDRTAAYFRSRGTAPVEVVTLERGGHTVPGSRSRFPRLAGETLRSWEGVRAAAAFFRSPAAAVAYHGSR